VTPLVSILVPAYNAEPWLAAALDSVRAQTWPRTETIVVDDGSTDGTLDVARRYEARGAGVSVLARPHRGASAARNTALAAATGAYFQFLDADDLLAPDKLERQMRLAASLPPDFALCSAWSRFAATPADADFGPQPLCTDAAPIEWMIAKFGRNAMMHPAAWLISRSLATRAGPWDETLTLDDDGEYFSRVVLASGGVRCCRDAVSYYRSAHARTLSRSKSRAAWTSAARSLELTSTRLLAAENSARTRRACATAYQQYIYDAYPHAADFRRRAAKKVVELGGSDLTPPGGPKFHWARRVLGWRAARRLQTWF
jgi:glycosyltransferase involved in cell wall biosynthesis